MKRRKFLKITGVLQKCSRRKILKGESFTVKIKSRERLLFMPVNRTNVTIEL